MMQILMFLMAMGGELPSVEEAMVPQNERELAIMGYAILAPLQKGLKTHVEDLSVVLIQGAMKQIIKSYPNVLYVSAVEAEVNRPWAQFSRDNIDLSAYLAESKAWALSRTKVEAKEYRFQGRTVYEFVLPIYTNPNSQNEQIGMYIRLGFVMEQPADQSIQTQKVF